MRNAYEEKVMHMFCSINFGISLDLGIGTRLRRPKEPGLGGFPKVPGGFLKEPGPAPPRHRSPIALEHNKNPIIGKPNLGINLSMEGFFQPSNWSQLVASGHHWPNLAALDQIYKALPVFAR